MAKTVIIFGAGASTPFFCPPITTDALTCLVQEETKWKSLLERYTTAMGNEDCVVNWDPILCLIQRARNIKKNLNFEQLIELIDKYSSYAIGNSVHANSEIGIQSKRQHDLLNFFYVNRFSGHKPMARGEVPVHLKMIVKVIEKFNRQLKLGFFKVKRPLEYDHYWDRVPFLFRQMIAETIGKWDSQFRSPDYCNLLTKQSEFLSGQLQQGNLSVYTFNYDDILPQTVIVGEIPLETGFVCGRFNSVKFLQAPSVLAFPHGHARWTQDDCGIRSFSSISVANSWRLKHLSDSGFEETSPYVDAPGAYNFNTFLTTGQDKEPSFSHNPYCAYYQRLAHDLLCANAVIVAGYSFRDPHIDRLLLNFLDLRPKDNKVLVIDRLEDDIDLIQEFMDTEGFLRRVLCKHGVTSVQVTDTENPLYKYADQLENTNKVGYGCLCPQIWIYKHGYRKFLSEWQTVLGNWRCPP